AEPSGRAPVSRPSGLTGNRGPLPTFVIFNRCCSWWRRADPRLGSATPRVTVRTRQVAWSSWLRNLVMRARLLPPNGPTRHAEEHDRVVGDTRRQGAGGHRNRH